MLTERNQSLFSEGDLARTLDAYLAQVVEEVNIIPKNQFLFSNDQDIVDHILSKMLINPIELHLDSQEMTPEEIQIDYESRYHSYFDRDRTIRVPGTRITVSIPFSGDHILWKLRPSSFPTYFPVGIIRTTGMSENGFLDIICENRTETPPQEIKNELDQNINLIKRFLEYQLQEINKYNEQLPGRIRNAIASRRDRLEKEEGLVKFLNIPLKTKDGTPPLKPIQLEKRIIRQLPSPPIGGYKPEWAISDSDYEEIITIIRHQGKTFETSPLTYAVHGEEDLRNMILATVAYYKGGASGETFRKSGKTDIQIEMESRAAFVAECKVWSGQKAISSAIDQLLKYLVWYDCKTALIIFNKDIAKFNELLEKLPSTIQEHPKYLKSIPVSGIGEWRYKFSSPEDESRQITIHVFLFNLYVE